MSANLLITTRYIKPFGNGEESDASCCAADVDILVI